MKILRLFVAVVLIVLLANMLFGAEIPYPVPDQIRELPDDQYRAVIELHNDAQYQKAAEDAAPGQQLAVDQDTSTTVVSGGVLYTNPCNNGWSSGNYIQIPTRIDTWRASSRRTFEFNRYGGGPIWIINPFARFR